MNLPARLHPDDRAAMLAAVRFEVRKWLADNAPAAHDGGLMDAGEVAARLGMTERWVRNNKDKLGVVRVGDGLKPRLRFDPAKVEEYAARRAPGAARPASVADVRARRPGRPRRRAA